MADRKGSLLRRNAYRILISEGNVKAFEFNPEEPVQEAAEKVAESLGKNTTEYGLFFLPASPDPGKWLRNDFPLSFYDIPNLDVGDSVQLSFKNKSRPIRVLLSGGNTYTTVMMNDTLPVKSLTEMIGITVGFENSVPFERVSSLENIDILNPDQTLREQGFVGDIICGIYSQAGAVTTYGLYAQLPFHEGKLYRKKQTSLRGLKSSLANWVRRWYVLRKNQFAYFKSKEDDRPLGFIDLTQTKRVRRIKATETETLRDIPQRYRGLCFAIETSDRTYVLLGDSADDIAGWIDSLDFARRLFSQYELVETFERARKVASTAVATGSETSPVSVSTSENLRKFSTKDFRRTGAIPTLPLQFGDGRNSLKPPSDNEFRMVRYNSLRRLGGSVTDVHDSFEYSASKLDSVLSRRDNAAAADSGDEPEFSFDDLQVDPEEGFSLASSVDPALDRLIAMPAAEISLATFHQQEFVPKLAFDPLRQPAAPRLPQLPHFQLAPVPLLQPSDIPRLAPTLPVAAPLAPPVVQLQLRVPLAPLLPRLPTLPLLDCVQPIAFSNHQLRFPVLKRRAATAATLPTPVSSSSSSSSSPAPSSSPRQLPPTPTSPRQLPPTPQRPPIDDASLPRGKPPTPRLLRGKPPMQRSQSVQIGRDVLDAAENDAAALTASASAAAAKTSSLSAAAASVSTSRQMLNQRVSKVAPARGRKLTAFALVGSDERQADNQRVSRAARHTVTAGSLLRRSQQSPAFPSSSSSSSSSTMSTMSSTSIPYLVGQLTAYINETLELAAADSSHFAELLPMQPSFCLVSLQDGAILLKLLEHHYPQQFAPSKRFDASTSLARLTAALPGAFPTDYAAPISESSLSSDPQALLGVAAAVASRCLVSSVSLARCPRLVELLGVGGTPTSSTNTATDDDDEEEDGAVKELAAHSPEQLLAKWVNVQLGQQLLSAPLDLQQLADGRLYSQLLERLSNGAVRGGSSPDELLASVRSYCRELPYLLLDSGQALFSAAESSRLSHLVCLASLLLIAATPPPDSAAPSAVDADQSPLGHVSWTRGLDPTGAWSTPPSDGYALLNVLAALSADVPAPVRTLISAPREAGAAADYAAAFVDAAQLLGVGLPAGVSAARLANGDSAAAEQALLALRVYEIANYQRISQVDIMTEDGIIAWINDLLESSPLGFSEIQSFAHPGFRSGVLFLALLSAVFPQRVAAASIAPGVTLAQRRANFRAVNAALRAAGVQPKVSFQTLVDAPKDEWYLLLSLQIYVAASKA